MDGIKKIIVERPWGKFEQFVDNEKCAVKLHYLKPNERWSLQYHNKRDEFWKILKGDVTVVIGDKEIKGKEGDEFWCPKGEKHRIIAGNNPVTVLEICFGEFEEHDEVRLEDKYNRKYTEDLSKTILSE